MMPTARLSGRTLASLSATVRRPAYDRNQLAIGMAHLGVGAFHRCHQAEFTDDMLEQRFGDWGVVGINLKPPLLGETLGVQDGLYSRTLRRGSESETRVIGCIRRVIDGGNDMASAIDAIASPEISVVTITITEKGYCHVPASGKLDERHQDVVHDLANPSRPRSAIGLLVEALDRRRRAHGNGLTLVSCDNIPSNGDVLRDVLLTFAEGRSREIAAWIRGETCFPSTMVDRIVPASQAEDFERAAMACGLEDHAAVVGEPFRQWVIEDAFRGRRPEWDLAGAEFVSDVRPYELVKMRLLNAAQSAWAYLGALAGLEFTFQSARDPVLGQLVTEMLVEESAPTVPDVPSMRAMSYIPSVVDRVRNDAVRHTNHQVATDGSQKIVQRFLNPIRDRLHAGERYGILALGVAGWIAYLVAGTSRFGNRWTPQDPWAERIGNVALSHGEAGALVKEIVAIEPIFGNDLRSDEFVALLAVHVEGLLSANPHRYIARQLAARSR